MDNLSPNQRDVALVELLDRVVDRGVVLSGDIVISVADVDLIYLGLRVLIQPAGEILGTARETEQNGRSGEPDDFLLRLRGDTEPE